MVTDTKWPGVALRKGAKPLGYSTECFGKLHQLKWFKLNWRRAFMDACLRMGERKINSFKIIFDLAVLNVQYWNKMCRVEFTCLDTTQACYGWIEKLGVQVVVQCMPSVTVTLMAKEADIMKEIKEKWAKQKQEANKSLKSFILIRHLRIYKLPTAVCNHYFPETPLAISNALGEKWNCRGWFTCSFCVKHFVQINLCNFRCFGRGDRFA